MKPTHRLLACLVVLAVVWGARPVAAQDDEEDTDPLPKMTEEEAAERKERIEDSANRQIESGQNSVHIYQLVEEMTDELIADLSDLDASVVSPMAVRKLGVTPNLSADFAGFVEGTIVSSIASQTSVAIKRCVSCDAVRSRQEDGEWVVTMGLAGQDDLEREAERIGVDNFMNAHLSYFPEANVVAMQVDVMRASDGAILWSETYRSDATTAAILRSGDRVMSRAERVEELERKLEERPEFGYAAHFGISTIPYDIPAGSITGAAGGVRLFELLGDQKRWRYGIGADGFANFSTGSGGDASSQALVGGFFGATAQYRIRPIDLNEAVFWTGPTVNGFLAGTEGNSMSVEWDLEGIFQFRLGAGATLMYFVPVRFAERDLGGLGYKFRLSFNW